MQVVALQIDSVWEDKLANHEKVKELLKTVTVSPGAMIVLPEMFATGYTMNVEVAAENDSLATRRFLASIAQQYQCYIVAGLAVRSRRRPGCGRNEAVVIDPQGLAIAHYTKMHPFSLVHEQDKYEAGRQLVTFFWGGFVVSPFICYDVRFPEAFRRAVQKGSHVMVVIANFPAARVEHWTTLLKARAIENQAYVIGVNRTGKDPQAEYSGRSIIVGPRGDVLAEAGERETALVAELDLRALLEYRAKFPVLGDMRFDLLSP